MRHLFRLALVATVSAASAVAAQNTATPVAPPAYDAALAEGLGADQRGMKNYVLVILKAGPKSDFTKEESASLFAGHMANMKRLAAEGKLVVAGPFAANASQFAGLFILNVKTVKDAEALLVTDPAVAAGRFAFDAYGWYGSAALQETNAIHNRIDKTGR